MAHKCCHGQCSAAAVQQSPTQVNRFHQSNININASAHPLIQRASAPDVSSASLPAPELATRDQRLLGDCLVGCGSLRAGGDHKNLQKNLQITRILQMTRTYNVHVHDAASHQPFARKCPPTPQKAGH